MQAILRTSTRTFALLLFAMLAGLAQEAVAADARTRVQAVFLYKFCNYVEWPRSTFSKVDSPVVIGFIGSESLAAEVTSVTSGRRIGDRPVRVRLLQDAQRLEGIHLLFIGESRVAGLDQAVLRGAGAPILTVTDSDNPAVRGMINFVSADNRVRFDIANSVAREAGIRLDADLLAVAHKVD